MSEQQKTVVSFVSEYRQQLFGFIRKRVRATEDAEDLLQEIWFRLSNVVDLEEIESVGSWLYRVARNLISDSYKKKKPLLLNDLVERDDEAISKNQHLMLSTSDVEHELQSLYFWEELEEAVDRLPDEQKLVFEENVLGGKGLVQIAAEQNLNVKTVISRKAYAIKKIRKDMGSIYEEFINTK